MNDDRGVQSSPQRLVTETRRLLEKLDRVVRSDLRLREDAAERFGVKQPLLPIRRVHVANQRPGQRIDRRLPELVDAFVAP